MSDWKDNTGRMPVKPDAMVFIWLRVCLTEPLCRFEEKAGNLIWRITGSMGDILKWKRA